MMLTRGFGSIGTFCGGSGLWYTGAWIGLGLVFVAAVVVIAVLASRKKRSGGSEAALEALKLRYVKGELTEEEYYKMKELIGK